MMHHLWRRILLTVGILTILSGAVIYVARLPDQEVCAVVFRFNAATNNVTKLIDLNTGREQADTRINRATPGALSFWTAPNRQYDLELRSIGHSFDHLSYSLVEMASQREIPLLSDVQAGQSDMLLMKAAWAPDSQQVAMIWQNQNQDFILSMAQVSDGSVHSVPLAKTDTNGPGMLDPRLQNWSADGRFLAIAEASQIHTYSFWDTAPLQRAPVAVPHGDLLYGAWSPAGHQFAAVMPAGKGTSPQLVILSPEGAVVTAKLESKLETRAIVWSPDGQYLTVAGLYRFCKDTNPCERSWSFQLFTSAGVPIGALRRGISYMEQVDKLAVLPDQTLVDTRPLPGIWKDNTWSYVSQQPNGQLDLVALNVLRGTETRIAENLLPAYVEGMFYATLDATPDFGRVQTTSVPHPLIVASRQRDKIQVEMMDADGMNRHMLVAAADKLVDARAQNQTPNRFWVDSGSHAVIAWTEGPDRLKQSHLLVVSADGTQQADTAGMEYVSKLTPVYTQKRTRLVGVSFVSEQKGDASLNFLNIQTRQHFTVVQHYNTELQAEPIISPLNQYLGIYVRDYSNETMQLYVVPVDGSRAVLGYDLVKDNLLWSADGQKFLIKRKVDSGMDTVLEVWSVAGERLRSIRVPYQSGSTTSLIGWTKCD